MKRLFTSCLAALLALSMAAPAPAAAKSKSAKAAARSSKKSNGEKGDKVEAKLADAPKSDEKPKEEPAKAAPADAKADAKEAPKEAPKDATKEPAPTAAATTAAAAPAAAPAAPPPAPELPERVIEKRDDVYVAKIVVRPGNLRVRRTADVSVDLQKVLDIPDPVTGDRASLNSARTYVTVLPPAPPPQPEPPKGKKAPPPPAPPVASRYQLWPVPSTGTYGFHFTPELDGVYQLTVVGTDPTAETFNGEPRKFEVTFRVGVGSAAAQTEVSAGSGGSRRASRRALGGSESGGEANKLQKIMEEVGPRWLDLADTLQRWPAKGPHADATAEARAIAALLDSAKGLAPEGTTSASAEFDKLAAAAAASLNDLAALAEADGKEKDRAPRLAAATAAFEKVELQSCTQCHAKFRWGVTTDLSEWPKFSAKPWKK
jgi:hypothetical protein